MEGVHYTKGKRGENIVVDMGGHDSHAEVELKTRIFPGQRNSVCLGLGRPISAQEKKMVRYLRL